MENNPTWIPVVALALRNGDGRWLMQCRPPGKAHAGLWEFPGGKVEVTEKPREALIREVLEELDIAIRPDDLEPVGMADHAGQPGRVPIVILLYSARRWEGTPRSLEGGRVDWFGPAEIEELPMPPLDVKLLSQLRREFGI
ncbi:(deoxy)nucleoside triphosphate pyrophosphohydrolase [Qipengyuania sp. JC766]|uniref:(deoxy)nucleoside triphosphate pyrophosphohydrolase n=1 Tax=Qipengyuania sp. JC766 TaxID=3232139 RepID=UPI00345A5E69